MQRTYLLAEGINIYPNVLDTDQLSVIRGSSFILKNAIEHLKKKFSNKLTPITTGASSGLFCVKDGTDTLDLVGDVIAELENPPYCHFTFAVEQCLAEDLLQAKEQLLAQLRFHQMSAVTMVPDLFNQEHQQKGHPCQLEGCRIAAKNTERKVQVGERDTPRTLSLSVYDRLLFGREQRQDFYFREGDIGGRQELEKYSFTDDLENLAENKNYPNLNNKIAVIYMDGNKFSAIQREMLQSARKNGTDLIEAQNTFDDDIKRKRATFLKNTLLEMVRPESFRFPDVITKNRDGKDAIRFETLLWGGDEMLFILPAWSGFELLQSFFRESANWNADKEPLNNSDHLEINKELRLTHAAGIVFCNAKSPIRVIRDIAQSLADTIKNRLGDARKVNTWDYMVLESIDYPVSKDIKAFNKGRYGDELAESRPPCFSPAANWDETKQDLARLITDGLLSRRQLYRIVDALNKQSSQATLGWSKLAGSKELGESATPQELAEHRMLLLMEPNQRRKLAKTLPALANGLFGIDMEDVEKRVWLWLNLIELWDYLVPARKED